MNTSIGKRELTKLQNREKILAAARSVFLELGYDGCNVRDIIRRTELAAGTFYNYYPDKLAVFKALIDDFVTGLSLQLHQIREQAKDLDSFVTGTYQLYFQSIAEDPVSYELSRRNEEVIGNIYDYSFMELAQEILIKDIEDAIARNIMPQVNVDYLAAAFLGVGMNVGRTMTDTRPMEPEKAAEFAAKLFLGGITQLPEE